MSEEKQEKLSKETCDRLLEAFGDLFEHAPPAVRGASIILQTEQTGTGLFGGFGSLFGGSPLKREVYDRAKWVVTDWVMKNVLSDEEYTKRRKAEQEREERLAKLTPTQVLTEELFKTTKE